MPSLHLFPHGAFQGLWNVFAAKDRHWELKYKREFVKLDDGGQVALDWAYPDEEVLKNQESVKVCVIFPGISGGSEKGYVKSLVRHLAEDKGYICAVFLNRGVSIPFTSPHFIDYSSSKEIEAALNSVKNRFKNQSNVHFVGVGMSMGANLMLRVAGEKQEEFPLEALVSLNNPFDLWLAINLMRGSPYEKFLAKEFKRDLIFSHNLDSEIVAFKQMSEKFNINFEDLKPAKTWKELDELLTVKVHSSFKNAPDYWYAVSCLPIIS